MQPYEAFKLYLALKQHFTSSYDYFKYGGNVKATESSFEKRNDKPYFFKLAKHKDIEGLLVSTHVRHGDLWIGDIVHSAEVAQSYAEWKKVQESFSYAFKNDFEQLGDIEQAIKVVEGQHPLLLRRVLSRQTNVETMIVLNTVIKFVPAWNKRIQDPIIWPGVRFKCKKYKPFLQYDKERINQLLGDENALDV